VNVEDIYQTSVGFDVNLNKYRTNANCESSTCDYAGLSSWYGGGGTAYPIDFSCGTVDFSAGFACSGTYSDVRLKNGIKTLENVLESIMKIEAVEYDWNENLNPTLLDYFKKQQKLHTIGLIAQNVRLYFPEVVRMNQDGYYSIDYHKLNAVLVEGIKEQQIFIEDIDKQLEYIESKIK
jgi:hypothetical protein